MQIRVPTVVTGVVLSLAALLAIALYLLLHSPPPPAGGPVRIAFAASE
jgi:hypothetical protein